MIVNSEATQNILSLLISAPCSSPWQRAYLTHNLYLFDSLPLLADYTDTLLITPLTLTATDDLLLLLLASLGLFDLFLSPLLFRLNSQQRILSLEPVIDQVVTAFLDVLSAAWLRNPVEPQQLTLPVVVADQLPLAVAKLEDAWSQH